MKNQHKLLIAVIAILCLFALIYNRINDNQDDLATLAVPLINDEITGVTLTQTADSEVHLTFSDVQAIITFDDEVADIDTTLIGVSEFLDSNSPKVAFDSEESVLAMNFNDGSGVLASVNSNKFNGSFSGGGSFGGSFGSNSHKGSNKDSGNGPSEHNDSGIQDSHDDSPNGNNNHDDNVTTFNVPDNNDNPQIPFTPATPVPEPSTYGLIAAVFLVALAIRKRYHH